MEADAPSLDAAAEKRIRRVVYCADQLFGTRRRVWVTRYHRAVAAVQSVPELDEAMARVHAKYPQIGLDKTINCDHPQD